MFHNYDEPPPSDGTTSRLVGVSIFLLTALIIAVFGGWELLDWLRTAAWPRRSISTFFPVQWDTGWDGINVVLGNVWRTWIGIPILLVGVLFGWVFLSEAVQEDRRAAEFRSRRR